MYELEFSRAYYFNVTIFLTNYLENCLAIFIDIKLTSFVFRAREKFQQIMKATQDQRQRSQKVEALKMSTIPPSKGIEEESSE